MEGYEQDGLTGIQASLLQQRCNGRRHRKTPKKSTKEDNKDTTKTQQRGRKTETTKLTSQLPPLRRQIQILTLPHPDRTRYSRVTMIIISRIRRQRRIRIITDQLKALPVIHSHATADIPISSGVQCLEVAVGAKTGVAVGAIPGSELGWAGGGEGCEGEEEGCWEMHCGLKNDGYKGSIEGSIGLDGVLLVGYSIPFILKIPAWYSAPSPKSETHKQRQPTLFLEALTRSQPYQASTHNIPLQIRKFFNPTTTHHQRPCIPRNTTPVHHPKYPTLCHSHDLQAVTNAIHHGVCITWSKLPDRQAGEFRVRLGEVGLLPWIPAVKLGAEGSGEGN